MRGFLIIAIILGICVMGFSQSVSEMKQPIGFLDKDRDGVNDWFRDANGDGINDVDLKPYPHSFEFVDKNKDGINDLYVDSDGDGVNDLTTDFIDRNHDNWNDNVVDVNKDWINDITGLIYNRMSLRGERYGYVIEERGIKLKDFVDRNGDGQDDRIVERKVRDCSMDRFIDRDGDGVCDGRGFDRHRRIKSYRGGRR